MLGFIEKYIPAQYGATYEAKKKSMERWFLSLGVFETCTKLKNNFIPGKDSIAMT